MMCWLNVSFRIPRGIVPCEGRTTIAVAIVRTVGYVDSIQTRHSCYAKNDLREGMLLLKSNINSFLGKDEVSGFGIREVR